MCIISCQNMVMGVRGVDKPAKKHLQWKTVVAQHQHGHVIVRQSVGDTDDEKNECTNEEKTEYSDIKSFQKITKSLFQMVSHVHMTVC